MSEYRKIFLSVNPELASIVDPAVPDTSVSSINFIPAVYNGETVVFCIGFIDSEGKSVAIPESDIFELSIDCNFAHDSDPLMAYSRIVNEDADWDQADYEEGKISIRVTCATSSFNEKLASAERISAWLEIKKIAGVSGKTSVMLLTPVIARNVIRLNEDAPEAASVDYYTAAETDALIAAITGGSPEVRFSADGTSWHPTQSAADRYWSFRMGSSGGWSSALAIPQPQTPAGRVEYAFSVDAGSTASSIPVDYSDLGIDGITDLSLFEVQPNGGELNITHNSNLMLMFYADRLELIWNGTFPAGTYTIRG